MSIPQDFLSVNFRSHIGIDYSGAAKPETRSATIQVYACDGDTEPNQVYSPSSTKSQRRNWNRRELASWLVETLNQNNHCLVGIDHGFSFPITYFKRYQLESWASFINDFVEHWPTHQAGATVEQYRSSSKRTGDARDLRLTEQWTSSAKSVFRFDVQGSVAKSTHAGLPFLRKLRDEVPNLHFWPFDGWGFPDDSSVVFETYPSLFRNRYERETRTVDQQDAYSICCWLLDMNRLGRLEEFASPPLSNEQRAIANLEGWIFGVF